MFKTIGKAKIRNDNIAVAVEEEVFEFQVSVDNFLLVDVPDTGNELGEELCSISFFKIAVGENMVKEFSARGVFKDDTDVFVSFDNIIKTHNVGMFERLGTKPVSRQLRKKDKEADPKNLDFPLNLGKTHNCVDISSTNELDSYFLAPLNMDAELDLAELALAEGLKEKIRAKARDCAAWMSGHIGLNSRVAKDIRIGRILRGFFLVVRSGN